MTPSHDLAELGQSLGAARWAQGPGGNVSIKDGGDLYVKASGRRLVDVLDCHVKVSRSMTERALDGDPAAAATLFAGEPRPSLEVYFHALGGRVIAHTHPIGVLLAACAARASDLPATWVPWAEPGRPIALAVRRALRPDSDVQALVLASHGLLISAPTAREAVDLTIDLDERARAPFGTLPSFETQLEETSGGRLEQLPGGVAKALPPRPASLPARYLFPDAVIFASRFAVDDLDDETLDRMVAERRRAFIACAADGRRVAVAPTLTLLDFAIEVSTAHDWVEDGLTPRGLARYLPPEAPARLLLSPAEQYRMKR